MTVHFYHSHLTWNPRGHHIHVKTPFIHIIVSKLYTILLISSELSSIRIKTPELLALLHYFLVATQIRPIPMRIPSYLHCYASCLFWGCTRICFPIGYNTKITMVAMVLIQLLLFGHNCLEKLYSLVAFSFYGIKSHSIEMALERVNRCVLTSVT